MHCMNVNIEDPNDVKYTVEAKKKPWWYSELSKMDSDLAAGSTVTSGSVALGSIAGITFTVIVQWNNECNNENQEGNYCRSGFDVRNQLLFRPVTERDCVDQYPKKKQKNMNE